MASEIDTPPPPTSEEYFLKTQPVTGSTNFSSLYLRLRGDGISSVVLTEQPPKFLRWHHSPSTTSNRGQEIAVPWKHPDRSFGLVMGEPRKGYAWEEMRIVENEGDGGFVWERKDGRETLTWHGPGEAESGSGGQFRGWMWCPWVHGHPQLFWVTGMVDKEIPAFCEKVEIVKEWLVPRET
jgi:hypothetical protein